MGEDAEALLAGGSSARPTPPTGGIPPEAASGLDDPARRVARYVLVQRIGAGGMGEVWKAWDVELRRWVALKFLKSDVPDELARFHREAQMAAQLIHPNIAAIHEVGVAAGRHFIAMQYIAGGTLASLRASDVRTLVRLVRDAALAVDAAHHAGVIHRDLKPHNIMVEGDRVYVMDFGLAKQVSAGSSLTLSGMMVGTPGYMPPEQARGAIREIDARSDVYGLGATLYDLLADGPPFSDPDLYALVVRVVEEEPTRVRKRNPKVDEDLETVVMKCLEKERSRRYATARELAEDLTRWLDGEPVRARPISTMRRLAQRVRRHKAASAAGAALIVVLAAALGVVVAQSIRGARREAGLRQLGAQWSAIVERKKEMRLARVAPDRARRELADAVSAVDAYVHDWPGEPQGYYVRARGRLYLGDLERAEADLREALRRRGDFRPGWSLLGVVKAEEYQQRLAGHVETVEERQRELAGLLEEASKAFAQGWQETPTREEAERWGLPWTREDQVTHRLAHASRVKIADGSEAQARALVEAAMAEFEDEEYAGWLGTWVGTAQERLTWLGKAIALAPGFEKAWHHRGASRIVAGDARGAVEDLDQAIRLKPDYVWALYNRGVARRAERDLKGAVDDYTRALAMRPGWYEALMNRGFARAQLKDYAGAVADFDHALQMREHPDAYLNRGIARRAMDNHDGAIADFDRAIALKAGFVEAHYARGNARRAKRDWAGARADYDRALELRPAFAEALMNRGIVRTAQEDRAGAAGDFEEALRTAPADWPYRAQVEDMLRRLRR